MTLEAVAELSEVLFSLIPENGAAAGNISLRRYPHLGGGRGIHNSRS
mgnify:CR=1 FL=1